MRPAPTPVTSRRELARLLRSLRQQHELSLVDAAEKIDISAGFLSRAERGIRGLSDDNINALCLLYRTPPVVTEQLRQLASVSREQSWWDDPRLPRSMREYIGVEQVATSISGYGSIVPGLLQTPAYAAAVTEGSDLASPEATRATAITQRLRRQAVLDRTDPPWTSIVLDESALHRSVGGPATMREQVRALLAAAERPHVSIQVIPFAAGAHPGMDSSFVVLSTSEEQTPELVHVEGLSGYRNLEKPDELGHYTRAWQGLSAIALPPDESLELIERHTPAG